MTSIPEEALGRFVAACRQAAEHGLMRCSSGNMSWRIDEKHLLATTTRSWMSRLTTDDVAICAIADGSVVNGKTPTVEVSFHTGIMRARPDVDVVMHFQTPAATAMSCQDPGRTDYDVIPEIPYYIGPVARIPYFLPGSAELANAVTEAMQTHDVVLMGNHGGVTVAPDFDHAIQNAVFFELACDIIQRGGDAVHSLSAGSIAELSTLRRNV